MTARKDLLEPRIQLGSGLSEAFDELQQRIRERAYHIFLDRDDSAADSVDDWLEAQAELLNPVELVVKEQKKSLVAECNLKGFTPQEIEVEVENGVLKIFGSHRQQSSEEGTGERTESVYFFQSTTLPTEVDLDASHARLFKNGKLKVTLPKATPPASGIGGPSTKKRASGSKKKQNQ